jgi:hypothetical protein
MTMHATTSQLFDFIEMHPSLHFERHEVASAAFTDLRYSVRSIIVTLAETEEAQASETIGRLRAVLSEWLTVPTRFDDAMLNVLGEMGSPAEVATRWGSDVRSHYVDAVASAETLAELENPLRARVADLVHETLAANLSLRVFCHRRARVHFESLQADYDGLLLGPEAFIHTIAQYRAVRPFSRLLKAGPLRSRGWGAAPDALITAPRFDTLVQVVWSGCGDEPDFGYDPAVQCSSNGDLVDSPPRNRLGWEEQQSLIRDRTVSRRGTLRDVDDLELFRTLADPREARTAVLVQLEDELGVLYPPHSKAIAVAPVTCCAEMRWVDDALFEGMLLVIPVADDTRLTGLQAMDGQLSHIWKDKLRSKYAADPTGLVKALWSAGLQLTGLRSRVAHWCKSATTVIHAPQQKKHFQILIDVLGLGSDEDHQHLSRRGDWWRSAWDEIRRSRGEAIQAGVEEQRLIDEQLLSALAGLSDEIRANLHRPSFALAMPPGLATAGYFGFHRIVSVEPGFEVPGGELRVIHELERIDQWRA